MTLEKVRTISAIVGNVLTALTLLISLACFGNPVFCFSARISGIVDVTALVFQYTANSKIKISHHSTP